MLMGLLILAGSQAWAMLPAEQPYRIADSGRPVTDVYIDGKGPFTFLIDTASSRSLIFEHVRGALKLTQSQPGRLTVYGINDVADVMAVKPGELRVAGEAIRGLTLGVLPDSNMSGLDGILGVDVLSRYFVVLDRRTMRVKLLAPGAESARPYAGWAEAQLTPHALKALPIQFWYLKTRFNDLHVTALFDLGADTTMINWEAAERLGLRRHNFTAPPPALLQDVLGKDAPAVRLLDLDVGLPGKSWEKQWAIVADAPAFSYFDLDEKPAAIVGPGLLRDNSLAIDFAGQRLFVGPTLN
jgi:hypothetical protein